MSAPKRVPAKIDNFGLFTPESALIFLTLVEDDDEPGKKLYNVAIGLIFSTFTDNDKVFPQEGMSITTNIWNECHICAIKAAYQYVDLMFGVGINNSVSVIDPDTGEHVESYSIEDIMQVEGHYPITVDDADIEQDDEQLFSDEELEAAELEEFEKSFIKTQKPKRVLH